MAWIRVIRPGEAEGLLKQLYNAAIKRAGKVYNIISIQSLRPKVLRSSTRTYIEVMHSPECGLSRAQREMIATTVSAVNDCHYWAEAHGEDLRAEVQGQEGADELVAAIKSDYTQAVLTPADRAMLDFVTKLTLTPGRMVEEDLQPLRVQGFDDHAIHDIVQVTGLFAYYNRLADGLGIDLEPEMPGRRGM